MNMAKEGGERVVTARGRESRVVKGGTMSMGCGWGRWSTPKDRFSQHIFLIPKLSVNRITLQSQKALRELLLVHPFFEDQMSNGQTKNRLEKLALKRSQV